MMSKDILSLELPWLKSQSPSSNSVNHQMLPSRKQAVLPQEQTTSHQVNKMCSLPTPCPFLASLTVQFNITIISLQTLLAQPLLLAISFSEQ